MSAADFLRNRARNVLADVNGMVWQNREAAARALNIGATVLGLRRAPVVLHGVAGRQSAGR